MARMIWREPEGEVKNDSPLVGGEHQMCIETAPAVRTPVQASCEDKFEVKWRENNAWYDAALSLKAGMVEIDFTGFNGELEYWPVEALESVKPVNGLIRILSDQLQDTECGNVVVNKRVCGFYQSRPSEGWYDAVIIEVERRTHTFDPKGEVCTCRFMATWLEGPAKGRRGTLTCKKICLLSTKDVETHPLLLDIRRCVNNDGNSEDQQQASPGSTGVKEKMTRSGTEFGLKSPDQLNNVRRFKRLKSKSISETPNKGDEILDFVDLPGSAFKAQLMFPSVSIGTDLQGEPSPSKCGVSVADSAREESKKSKSSSHPMNFNCKDQLCGARVVPSAPDNSDKPCGSKLASSTRSAPAPHMKGRYSEINLSYQESERTSGAITGKNEGEGVHRVTIPNISDLKDLGNSESAKFEPSVDRFIPKRQPKLLAGTKASSEAKPFKKLRITVDIDVNASVSTRENHLESAETCAGSKVSECLGSDVLECPVSKVNECPVSKVNASAVNDHVKVDLVSSTDNDQPVDLRSCAGLGCCGQDVICLSDEEDCCLGTGKTAAPQSSWSDVSSPRVPLGDPHTLKVTPSLLRESFHRQPDLNAKRGDKQGWNVHSGDIPRNRNTLLTQLLKNSGCVLMIDYLELSVQPCDVLEMLLKLFVKDKVHSVHIPPLFPDQNRGLCYVVFMDKATADTALQFFRCGFVLSNRGRPWIVSRPGQELTEDALVGFPTMSAFMGEEHGNGRLKGGIGADLKVVTDRNKLEYKRAERLEDLVVQHRRQTRLMFQRHAQEEEELMANPESVIYH